MCGGGYAGGGEGVRWLDWRVSSKCLHNWTSASTGGGRMTRWLALR